MDDRAAAVLRANDYDPSDHRARSSTAGWLETYDLLLAMDGSNLVDLRRVGAEFAVRLEPDRIRLFRDFDPVEPGGDVPDPYYGGEQGFEEVLAMVERTCAVLVSALQMLPDLREPPSRPAGPAA